MERLAWMNRWRSVKMWRAVIGSNEGGMWYENIAPRGGSPEGLMKYIKCLHGRETLA